MLGGVRGALSIALAATITTSGAISEADLHTINTMVFGVAFITIMLQVPLLFKYVKRAMPEAEAFEETELDEQFARLSSYIEEMHRLRLEGRISEAEFIERLEESKRRYGKVNREIPCNGRNKEDNSGESLYSFPPLAECNREKKER